MQRSLLAKLAWLLLFLAIALFYFWGLGSIPLVGADEPRYAQVAREMLARHDLITPTLGGLPWFEKPPLLYWLIILSYRALGVSEYAARVGPAICGLLTAVFVYWTGRNVSRASARAGDSGSDLRADEDLGRWSALVWLASFGAITFSRGASFDIVLTMVVTGALSFFFVWEIQRRSGGESKLAVLLVLFHLFTGVSLLAKGLIGYVLIYGVVGFYYLLRRELPSRTLLKSFLWGLPLSIAVASIWYGPMLARHRWAFIDRFFIQHHFQRFVSNKYHHPGPIYFYLPIMIALVLPWSVFLAGALWSARRWRWTGESPADSTRIFALAWLILPVVFFSFSGSKLAAYVLPAVPAVSLLVGERIVCYLKQKRGHLVLRLTGACLLILIIAVVWVAHRNLGFDITRPALALSPVGLVACLALIRPQLRKPLIFLIALVPMVTAMMMLRPLAPVIARRESVRDLLGVAAARGYSNTPLVMLHTLERTSEFYAAGRISYDSDGEPSWFETVAEVVAAAHNNDGLVLCIVPVEYQSQLRSTDQMETQVIGDNGQVALVVVRVR